MLGKFTNSKVSSDKVFSNAERNLNIPLSGNTNKWNVGLASNTKAAINPTTDSDDGDARAAGRSPGYGTGNAGGASGDRSMGYPGGGAGVSSLDGAQGN